MSCPRLFGNYLGKTGEQKMNQEIAKIEALRDGALVAEWPALEPARITSFEKTTKAVETTEIIRPNRHAEGQITLFRQPGVVHVELCYKPGEGLGFLIKDHAGIGYATEYGQRQRNP